MEESQDTVEERQPTVRMSRKRILTFALLFGILITSLFYVLPAVMNPLRIDDVPAGAYVVPWMQPYPYFGEIHDPFNIDSIMADALKLNMTFHIDIPNGTRVIPSTVYLGHDSKYLYVGGKFVGMYSNPASVPGVETEPNRFHIYFDVVNDGVLKTPEAGSGFAVMIDVPEETLSGGECLDMFWQYAEYPYNHMIWMPAENYLMTRGGQPFYSAAAKAQEYDSSTGAVTILFARYLNRRGIENIDALQMRPGERWVMGFLLELEYQKELANMVDGWPRNIYPYMSDDSSWWPKLVIDLTNPPPNMAIKPVTWIKTSA
jgi:hypothetical protein